MLLMSLGTNALLATIVRLQRIALARRIYETNFRLRLLDMMLDEVVKEGRSRPSLSEDEFVLKVAPAPPVLRPTARPPPIAPLDPILEPTDTQHRSRICPTLPSALLPPTARVRARARAAGDL